MYKSYHTSDLSILSLTKHDVTVILGWQESRSDQVDLKTRVVKLCSRAGLSVSAYIHCYLILLTDDIVKSFSVFYFATTIHFMGVAIFIVLTFYGRFYWLV